MAARETLTRIDMTIMMRLRARAYVGDVIGGGLVTCIDVRIHIDERPQDFLKVENDSKHYFHGRG